MAINWNKIKTEYITTDISYRELSEKYGIPDKQVERKGLDGKWVDLRKEYQGKMSAKVIEKAGDTEAEAIRKMKEKERLEFDKLNNIIWRSISEQKTDDEGNIIKGEYQVRNDLTPLDADRVVSAKYKLQTMIYKNYGIADKHELLTEPVTLIVSDKFVKKNRRKWR